ncbi:Fic family protein [Acidiferrobacter sp.]|jgi:hypothetical protein|uniref:Fic family protein n=1 Tax=Acidiferrobacter sp. TaxID=1872107 RepID=UPI002635880F|nr:Fic family protein [Acidiferrobacter sp.]
MLIFRTATNRTTLANAVRSGRLVRLDEGIYSTDTQTDPIVQIQQNVPRVLAYLRPGCVISHHSAILEDFGAADGLVIVSDPAVAQSYLHHLPGLKVLAVKGPGPVVGDSELTAGGVYAASVWRAALENLEPRRRLRALGRSIVAPPPEIEAFLARRMTTSVEAEGFLQGVNLVMRESGQWSAECARVSTLVQSRLRQMAALAPGMSPWVDHQRVRLFEDLANQLLRGQFGNEAFWGGRLLDFPSRPVPGDRRFLNLAFYESYFSNYIEGTEFAPEDARVIALEERQDKAQSKEGHDIRSLYRLYADPESFLREDHSPDEFIANLKFWHARFGEHIDKEAIHPGRFKDKANRAGGTWFADPAQVEGTLRVAWEIGQHLSEPFDRAVFRAVSTVNIHPFLDGNGRITRLAAANVLGRAGKMRLMIPTVFREDYILALRAFSNGNPVPVIRMFQQAARITTSVPFDRSFPELTQWLRERNAFLPPEEAKWRPAPEESDLRPTKKPKPSCFSGPGTYD